MHGIHSRRGRGGCAEQNSPHRSPTRAVSFQISVSAREVSRGHPAGDASCRLGEATALSSCARRANTQHVGAQSLVHDIYMADALACPWFRSVVIQLRSSSAFFVLGLFVVFLQECVPPPVALSRLTDLSCPLNFTHLRFGGGNSAGVDSDCAFMHSARAFSMVASTAGTPHYRPSSPGGRTTPAGKFGEADPVGQRRLHDVEAMLRDSNLKVDRLTSKLTGSHQEVQRLRTQLEAQEKDLVYQTRLAERVKREQVRHPATHAPLLRLPTAPAPPLPLAPAPTPHSASSSRPAGTPLCARPAPVHSARRRMCKPTPTRSGR